MGIDPVGAHELRTTVKQLIGRGKTILLTTHYMAEADELCDRIAIIKQGHIIALDTPASLKKKISEDSIIEIKVEAANLTSVQNSLARLGNQAVISYSENNFIKGISITTPQPGIVIEMLSPLLTNNVIQNLEVRNQTLGRCVYLLDQGRGRLKSTVLGLFTRQMDVQLRMRTLNPTACCFGSFNPLYSVVLV